MNAPQPRAVRWRVNKPDVASGGREAPGEPVMHAFYWRQTGVSLCRQRRHGQTVPGVGLMCRRCERTLEVDRRACRGENLR